MLQLCKHTGATLCPPVQWIGGGQGNARHGPPDQSVLEPVPRDGPHLGQDPDRLHDPDRHDFLVRKWRGDLHIRHHQVVAHARKPAGHQPGHLRLRHHDHQHPHDGYQSVLRDLGARPDDVRHLRRTGLGLRLQLHLVHVHDLAGSLPSDRQGHGRPADDHSVGPGQDRLHLVHVEHLVPGTRLRLEQVSPRTGRCSMNIFI